MNVENDNPFIFYLNNLNGFTKIDCLSEGSFSTVHSVKECFTGNMFCVKSFEFDGSDPFKRKIFSKYANELHNLDFPTLIPHQIFSFADLDNQYFPSFIYPFFSKQSLKKNINKLNNTNIMIILIGVSEGLRYLHQNNIAHGALEPSNILLDGQLRPILTSFGLGKMIEEFNTIDPQIPMRGSFNYLAPHYTFQSSEEFKSDIYAFGLITYYLLVKKDPYCKIQKIIRIPSKIVAGSLPKISEILSSDFINFLYRCLVQIPQERPNILEVCKEVSKLRLPNVDIEQINEYKEFLRKESINPFIDFKRATYNMAQQHPTLSMQQQQQQPQPLQQQQEDPQQQYKMQLNQNLQQRLQQYQVSDPHLKEIQQRLQLQLQQRFEKNPKSQSQPISIPKINETESNRRFQLQQELELLNLNTHYITKIRSKNLESEVIAIFKKINSDEDEPVQGNQPQPQQQQQNQAENQENDSSQQQNQESDDWQSPVQSLIFSEDDNDDSHSETVTRRKSSRQRKKRLNPFSDSSSQNSPRPHSSQSDDELKNIEYDYEIDYNEIEEEEKNYDENDDSDLPYENKRMVTRKSTQIKSQNSKKKTNSSKPKPKSRPKSNSKKSKKSVNNNISNTIKEDIDSIDFLDEKYQDFKEDIEKSKSIKSIFSENEDDIELQEVISRQHPTPKNANSDDEIDKYFANFNLSDDFKQLIKSAKSGDAESQNQLGIDLMNGKESVPSDPKEAFKYFQLSANQNYLEAVINLGHCYEDGSGTTRDTKQAFTLYNEAYEQGEVSASLYLGHCYEEGIGCEIDKEKAAEMYKICFQNGIAVAQYGRCLLLGIGIESNPQAAFDLISSFDENRDNGLTLLKGLYHELALDIQESINCYNRAIDQGNEEAKIRLALLLLSMGVVASNQRIKSNFSSITSFDYHIGNEDPDIFSFDNSFALDIQDLGPRNDPIQLLTEAASSSTSSKMAKIVLAGCFLRGVGTDVDSRSAIRYYNSAAASNSLEGIARSNLYSIPFSIKNINMIKMAAQSQNDVALVIYGRLLQKRIATEFITESSSSNENENGDNEMDPEIEALNLFKMASDCQSPIGMCQYGKTLLKRQRRAKLINQNELFDDVPQASNYVVDDEIENQAFILVKKSADLKYKGGLYNYARLVLEKNGVIRVDNSDNNIVLIKNDTEITKKRIIINFSKSEVKISNNNSSNSTENQNQNQADFDEVDDDDFYHRDVDLDQVRNALDCLRQAADLGNNNSRVLLGLFMKHGTFLRIEREAALSYFDLARKSGSKSGIYHFSRLYLKDFADAKGGNRETNSIMKELKSSINWERTPIKSKTVNFYGHCLAYGIGGIRRSLQDSLNYRKNASGYPFNIDTIFDSSALAAVDYGDLLNTIGKIDDKGVDKTKEKERKNEAIKCYRQAFLLDKLVKRKMNPKSAYLFGMACIKGKIIDKNVVFGLEFIKFAAEKENSHALLKCAKFFLNGIEGFVNQNSALAFQIYSFLADQGNSHGLVNVGLMLRSGEGVQKNEELGLQMIRKAAVEKNDSEAKKILEEVEKENFKTE